jgi:hypothetical protein
MYLRVWINNRIFNKVWLNRWFWTLIALPHEIFHYVAAFAGLESVHRASGDQSRTRPALEAGSNIDRSRCGDC